MNTIFIYGPPNAGKNYFVDCLCSFMLNYGKIENPSRNNNFPWMSGINRRINKWNEAKVDPHFEDNILDLMQGNIVFANVKFQAQSPLKKTPLIVMSNREVFTDTERFAIRHLRFDWQAAPLLIDYRHRKPHPMSVGYLLLFADNNKSYSYNCIYDILHKVMGE